MKNITSFFEKFSRLKPTARIIKKACHTVLNERKIPVREDEIIYHNNIIHLKTNSTVKNEVFLLKHELLSAINTALASEQVRDIR